MSMALWIGIGVVFLAILPAAMAKARKGGEDKKKGDNNSSADGGDGSHAGDSGDCGGDGGGCD